MIYPDLLQCGLRYKMLHKQVQDVYNIGFNEFMPMYGRFLNLEKKQGSSFRPEPCKTYLFVSFALIVLFV